MAECSDSSVTNKVNTQKQKTVIVPLESTKQNKTEKVLLIEEIKDENYPESYVALIEELHARTFNPTTGCDVIVLLLYILMLEEGFIPQGFEDEYTSINFNWSQILALSTKIPENWKRSNEHYEINFILAQFPKSTVRLICRSIEDDIIINCSIEGYRSGLYSMLIDPSQYVVISAINFRKRYQNVRQFAVTFKNKISNFVKLDVLHINGIGSSRLYDLPPEIIIILCKYAKCDALLDALN